MELFVSRSVLGLSNGSRFSSVSLPAGSRVEDLVQDVLTDHGFPVQDFYVTSNGHVCGWTELLLQGSVYHLEPRLCGGKGGFGSMLRALGAQIEKTTNREACRDLSGRRLRDVNHEKEMAEWLKKQAELEGEKDQRRVERLQRKLQEPRHHFTDPDYQQQCHDLSERLEDSVLKGMQACSSGLVSAEAGPGTKRANQHPDSVPRKKKCFWKGAGDLDLLDSEEEEDEEEPPGPSHQTRPEAAAPSCGSPSRPSAEPVCSGSDQPKPVCSGSDQPKPVCTGSHQPEPICTGSDQAEPEPVCTGSDQAEPEPVCSGSDQPEPVCTGSDQPEPEPICTGSNQPEPEPVCTGSDQPEPESLAQINQAPQQTTPQQTQSAPQQARTPLDLDSAGSPEDLEAVGLDQLKEELLARGLKCGGTLKERAARLYSVRGLTPEQIEPLLRAKTTKGKNK